MGILGIFLIFIGSIGVGLFSNVRPHRKGPLAIILDFVFMIMVIGGVVLCFMNFGWYGLIPMFIGMLISKALMGS